MVDNSFSNLEMLEFLVFFNGQITTDKLNQFTLTENDFEICNISFHKSHKYFNYLESKNIINFHFESADEILEKIEASDYCTEYKLDSNLTSSKESENFSGTVKIDKFQAFFETIVKYVQYEMNVLETEKNNILGFNPQEMNGKIINAKNLLEKYQKDSKDTPFLKGMENELKEFSKYLDSIKVINDNYTEVFKNIIKLIRSESDKSLKVTRNTAIISIIASAFVSIIIQNFHLINTFFANIVN